MHALDQSPPRQLLARSILTALLGLCAGLVPAIALADAGAVRISERRGEWKITIFTDPTPISRRERVWLHMATTRMRGGMVEFGLEFLEGVEMEPPFWWLRAMALHLAEGRHGSDASGFGFGERVLALATAGNDLATLRTLGAAARKGDWWTLAVRAFALAGDRDPVRRMIVEAVFTDAHYGVRLLKAIGVEIDQAVARDLHKARRTSMQQIRDTVRPLLARMQPAPMSPPVEDPDPEIDRDSLYDTYGAPPRPLSLKKVATMRALPAHEEEGEGGIWSETPQLLAEKRFACGAHDLAIETLVEGAGCRRARADGHEHLQPR